MNVYLFQVSLLELESVYRKIEVTGNCSFDDLHNAIFEAFNREEDHLYSFFITKNKTRSFRKIHNSPRIIHPYALDVDLSAQSATKTKIAQIDLEVKDVLYYLFDFGDEWWHIIKLLSITPSEKAKKCVRIVESVGESPPQYDEMDEDEDDEEYEDEDEDDDDDEFEEYEDEDDDDDDEFEEYEDEDDDDDEYDEDEDEDDDGRELF